MITLPESAAGQSPKSDLMTLAAKKHLGEAAAVVISALISHGRLSAKEISKRCELPAKLVKTTLVSLIQLNCILFWQEKEKVEYTFNEDGLVLFLHSGQIISHIKDEYDEQTAALVQNLIQNGHVRVDQLTKSFGDDVYTVENKVARLYGDGWIGVLQPHHMLPIEDLWNKMYLETLKQMPRSATTSEVKRVAEAKEISRTKLANLLESTPKNVYEIKNGNKVLAGNIQIRFNYERFEKHSRTKALVGLCESRIGIISAVIYEVALKCIEKNSPAVHPYLMKIDGMIIDPEAKDAFEDSIENKLIENKSIVFKTHEVSRHLPQWLDLQNSILTHNFLKPELKKRVASFSEIERKLKKPKLEEDVDVFDDVVQQDTSGSSELVGHHLKLLASSTSIPFIVELSPGTYTVPFKALKEALLEHTYEEIIKKSVGNDVSRILRCIKQLKLVDEKTIANSVLLKDKLVRNEIYKLVQLNVLEVQEIPRSNDRAASKTFFAFRYKKFSSYSFLKSTLLYNMAGILHLIEDFKLEQKVLLDKCEREDVKGHEAELLLASELRTLNNLKFREMVNMAKQ